MDCPAGGIWWVFWGSVRILVRLARFGKPRSVPLGAKIIGGIPRPMAEGSSGRPGGRDRLLILIAGSDLADLEERWR